MYKVSGILVQDENTNEPPFLIREKLNPQKVIIKTKHKVRQGDTLLIIADKYYGDSKYWWVIADINDTDKNPLIDIFDLELGRELLIPKID